MKPKSRIYWRVNPARYDHDSELCKQIDFYPWDADLLEYYAESNGYQCVEILEDSNGKNYRLYAEWIRT